MGDLADMAERIAEAGRSGLLGPPDQCAHCGAGPKIDTVTWSEPNLRGVASAVVGLSREYQCGAILFSGWLDDPYDDPTVRLTKACPQYLQSLTGTDQELEDAIDAAGRDRVVAAVRALGWDAGMAPPKWVWWSVVRGLRPAD